MKGYFMGELKLVSLHCDVMYKDKRVGRLDIEDGVLLKNECYTDNFIEHPCSRSKTTFDIMEIILDRVICEGRCDSLMLEHIGVKEYNKFEIFKKVHGIDSDDFIWFKFDEDPISLCWEDVKPPSR